MNSSNTQVLSFFEDKGKFSGIFSWILSTDHKRIGLLYLYSTLTLFIIGVILGLLIRLELISPGGDIVGP